MKFPISFDLQASRALFFTLMLRKLDYCVIKNRCLLLYDLILKKVKVFVC